MMASPGGRFLTLKLLRALLTRQAGATVPVPGLPDPPPERRRDPRRHRPAPLDRDRAAAELRRPRRPLRQARRSSPAKTSPRSCASAGSTPGEIPIVVMTHMHLDHTSAISEFPNSTFVVSEGRVGGGDDRPAARSLQRLPPRPLRLRLRLPHGRLRPRRDRLLRELRPHLRPLRRRLDPARLHARPQRRPHVGDLPPRRARLRDRRRRRSTRQAQLDGARRRRRARSTPTTTAARCRSCSSSARSTRDAIVTPGHDPEFYAGSTRATSSGARVGARSAARRA